MFTDKHTQRLPRRIPARPGIRRLGPAMASAIVFAAFAGYRSEAQESPGLGVEATPEQVAGWALTIMPDGTGLPPGSGTVAEGAAVFQQKCVACHGPEGQNGINDRLAGGHGTLSGDRPVKTIGSYWPYATTIFDYVRRAMPFTSPMSLTDDEVYALTAYLLSINGIIDDDMVIDAQSLPDVKMPNAGNFIWARED